MFIPQEMMNLYKRRFFFIKEKQFPIHNFPFNLKLHNNQTACACNNNAVIGPQLNICDIHTETPVIVIVFTSEVDTFGPCGWSHCIRSEMAMVTVFTI